MTRPNRLTRFVLLLSFLVATVALSGTRISRAQSTLSEEGTVHTPTAADTQPASETKNGAAESRYRTLATFRYGRALVGATGTKRWTSGATLATLPTDERGISRFVFSFAWGTPRPNLSDIRLVARGSDGNEIPSVAGQSGAASGGGTKHSVVTFVVAFKGEHADITDLVIEERTPTDGKHSLRIGSGRKWEVVLGPLTSGDDCSLDPPTDDEILNVVDKPLVGQSSSSTRPARVTKEKVADYVDPVRFVPLIGRAQLHHIHYKCTVYFGQNVDRSLESAGEESLERTAYVDHPHFHLIRD